MNNYDYPVGADNLDAPWNEREVTTSVTISMTISKSVQIEHDEHLILDREELERLVQEQITLPTDNDESWYIDDFIVLID